MGVRSRAPSGYAGNGALHGLHSTWGTPCPALSRTPGAGTQVECEARMNGGRGRAGDNSIKGQGRAGPSVRSSRHWVGQEAALPLRTARGFGTNAPSSCLAPWLRVQAGVGTLRTPSRSQAPATFPRTPPASLCQAPGELPGTEGAGSGLGSWGWGRHSLLGLWPVAEMG